MCQASPQLLLQGAFAGSKGIKTEEFLHLSFAAAKTGGDLRVAAEGPAVVASDP